MKRPRYYSYRAPRKRNIDWTRGERLLAYALRKDGKNTDSIREYFRLLKGKSIKRTMVYNLVRIGKAETSDLCFACCQPLVPEDKVTKKKHRHGPVLCNACKLKLSAYKKKMRKIFMKMGLCSVCGNKPPVPGHKSCVTCISATHRRRYEAGLCGACGKRPIAINRSKVLCISCLKNNIKRTALYRQKKLQVLETLKKKQGQRKDTKKRLLEKTRKLKHSTRSRNYVG
jgi:hypothetical protein